MTPTPTTRAWEALYRANTAANGAQTAAIGPQTAKRAIVSEMTMDEILAAGGTAENGGYNVQMLAQDFQSVPEKQQSALAYGPTIDTFSGLQVLNVNVNNGVVYLQIGDFVAGET